MKKLFVGYAETDITPQNGGIPLGGWGSTHLRLASNVLDRLYCHVTAFGSENKAECLLINVDYIDVYQKPLEIFREAVSGATGMKPENIIISGTHTHSAPDMISELDSIKIYTEYAKRLMSDCALRAMEDMKEAEVYYGKNEVGNQSFRLSFVRHYTMTDKKYKDDPKSGPVYYSGNNFGFKYVMSPDYIYTGHESEADPEIQLIEFRRKNADTVTLVNFQSHALITSGVATPDLSSDFPGVVCEKLNKMIPNSKTVYIQGCCGNINPCTRIREEAILGLNFDPFTPNDDSDNDHRAYAGILASYALEIHEKKLHKASTNSFGFTKKIYNAKCDHTRDHLVEKATPCCERFNKEGNTREVIEYANSLGFNSPYTARWILRKAKLPESTNVEINAISFGDVALVTAPFEVYDQIGKDVKKKSPFECTFMQCYSCGANSYLPAKGTTTESYEMDCTRFIPGTAEEIGKTQLEMLHELKENLL